MKRIKRYLKKLQDNGTICCRDHANIKHRFEFVQNERGEAYINQFMCNECGKHGRYFGTLNKESKGDNMFDYMKRQFILDSYINVSTSMVSKILYNK